MNIRKAKKSDAKQVATVHVETWRTAYRGIVSDNFLDNKLSIKRSAENIEKNFNLPIAPIFLVAENKNGRIIGFCRGGFNREKETFPQYSGELMAIYILDKYQRQSVGISLVKVFCDELRKMNLNNMIIRTLEKSKYKEFYKKIGGKSIGKSKINIGGSELAVITFGFDELPKKF